MLINFTKMHSFGNDFIIFDFRNQDRILKEDEIIYLADRNYGIGCDQIIALYKATLPDDEKSTNILVRIYNQDGTQASQCGNGVRCIAGYIARETNKIIVRVSIDTGPTVLAKPDKNTFFAKVNMGIPIVENDTVKIGNNHKIIIVKDFNNIDKTPNISYNVSYVRVDSKEQIFIRTVEMGVGETLSCGSAACAASAYCISNNLTNKVVKVMTRGSDIMDSMAEISWEGPGKPMLQGGGYTFVFTGAVDF
jgi:diaminopimelate epimerase